MKSRLLGEIVFSDIAQDFFQQTGRSGQPKRIAPRHRTAAPDLLVFRKPRMLQRLPRRDSSERIHVSHFADQIPELRVHLLPRPKGRLGSSAENVQSRRLRYLTNGLSSPP